MRLRSRNCSTPAWNRSTARWSEVVPRSPRVTSRPGAVGAGRPGAAHAPCSVRGRFRTLRPRVPGDTRAAPSSSPWNTARRSRGSVGRRCVRTGDARSRCAWEPMTVEIFKEFTFEAAHRLPNVPARPQVRAPPRPLLQRLGAHRRTGWRLTADGCATSPTSSSAMQPVLEQLDHYYLNDIEGLENPTSEVLARWIWDRLLPALPELSQGRRARDVHVGMRVSGRTVSAVPPRARAVATTSRCWRAEVSTAQSSSPSSCARVGRSIRSTCASASRGSRPRRRISDASSTR